MDVRNKVDDLDVHRLELFHLGRNGTQTEDDLVTWKWHVLAIDAETKHYKMSFKWFKGQKSISLLWDVDENVLAVLPGDEAVTLLAAEFLDLSMLKWVDHSPFRSGGKKLWFKSIFKQRMMKLDFQVFSQIDYLTYKDLFGGLRGLWSPKFSICSHIIGHSIVMKNIRFWQMSDFF
jgi:hypothetical protein